MSFRPRVAVVCSSFAESRMLVDCLTEEGYEPIRVSSHTRLPEELAQLGLDLLVVEAASAVVGINAVRVRRPQLPIVVIGASDAAAESHAETRGAVYLRRPIDRALFVCTIAMALAESLPARRSDRVPTRLPVVVQGVPSQIVDVSKEGMRIEMPRQLAVPPPLFDVIVPMLGVKVKVRRLWTADAPQSGHRVVWYGGELSNNSPRASLAWLTLVDALSAQRGTVKPQ